MDKNEKIALACAKEYDFTAVEYCGTYEGQLVYSPCYEKGEPCFIGPPRFVLVANGTAHMTSIPEGEAVCRALYPEDEE